MTCQPHISALSRRHNISSSQLRSPPSRILDFFFFNLSTSSTSSSSEFINIIYVSSSYFTNSSFNVFSILYFNAYSTPSRLSAPQLVHSLAAFVTTPYSSRFTNISNSGLGSWVFVSLLSAFLLILYFAHTGRVPSIFASSSNFAHPEGQLI